MAICFKHPRFHSQPQVPSNSKCRRYTGSAAPFVRKASPAHTAARLSLPSELARDKGILLVGHYMIGRPGNGGNNAGEESPGEFPKGVTLPLGKILARRGEPRYETCEAAGVTPAGGVVEEVCPLFDRSSPFGTLNALHVLLNET